MPKPKKEPSDKDLKARFSLTHNILDRINQKKWAVLLKRLIESAIEIRELFPDDESARQPLLGALDHLAYTAVSLLGKRSGYMPPRPQEWKMETRVEMRPITRMEPVKPCGEKKPVGPVEVTTHADGTLTSKLPLQPETTPTNQSDIDGSHC